MPSSALINVMFTAARKAGRSLARDFGEVEQLQVSLKGPANFVSAADHRAEEIIHAELSRARPGYSFLMEERGEIKGDDPTHRWIVDPLDGTTNFLHSIPIFSISIALEREGELVAGLIYNPATDETFTAEKGKGAFINDRRRLRVAARSELAASVICTGVPHAGRPGHDLFLKELRAIMAASAGIRRTGSAALDLAWTAAGRFDGFWERDLRPWDIAAGMVILREAGGYMSDANGKDRILEQGTIVAGNETIHAKLLKLLKAAGANATPEAKAASAN
ncbi:MAG: inositol monophosphatase family protein [Hyphomicrobiaceae bacterium]|jgi:myo-inositol-1(or 4)-monophosphatase|nr:inositol monophosphatase family protein [Hyphomicrobiaceae bacterium]MDX2449352.1 inositol monophosphatase family protein [Hyphomicrobiaceae bacterium]